MAILFIMLFTTSIYAQTTSENIFSDYYKMVKNNKNSNNFIAIDYAIKILKTQPCSMEAFYTLSLLPKVLNNEGVKTKTQELKETYYSDIQNVNSNTAEKIILLTLLVSDSNSPEEIQENFNFFKNTLIKIKEECINKDFAAIATFMLFLDVDNKEEYYNFFKTNYNEHPCIPLVDLIIISNYFGQKEYDKCINDAKQFIEKYKNITSPFGWKMIMDYYNLIIFNYIALNDNENAIKYYNIIENEAPDYDNIKQLQKILKIRKK